MKNKDAGRVLEVTENEYKELLKNKSGDKMYIDSNLVPLIDSIKNSVVDSKNTIITHLSVITAILLGLLWHMIK